MTRTRTTRYVTLLSVVLALALTTALAACGSDEPSGVTGPDRTASTPTETPASPARTPSTPEPSGVTGPDRTASTPTETPASPARTPSTPEPSGVTGPDRTASTPTETPASPARTPSTPGSGDAPTATDTPGPAAATAPPAASGSAETDRETLAALYNATDGENWDESANWLSDAPLGEWYGVTTNDDGRVTELRLFDNALSGEIPVELGSLSNLTSLVLYGNDLSGCVPGSLEDQLISYDSGLPFC